MKAAWLEFLKTGMARIALAMGLMGFLGQDKCGKRC